MTPLDTGRIDEMISDYGMALFWFATVMSVVIPLAIFLKRQPWRFAEGGLVSKPEKEVFRDLANPATRDSLAKFLQAHGITGEADIRDQKVFPAVPAMHLDPLAVVLNLAASRIDRLKNPNACALYMRDVEADRWVILDELSLFDLRNAARVITRVAEDRKKSRSIYKGFDDGELDSLVKAGLSGWLKRKGLFEQAQEIMSSPQYIHSELQRDIDMVRSVVELIFKVKGAEV